MMLLTHTYSILLLLHMPMYTLSTCCTACACEENEHMSAHMPLLISKHMWASMLLNVDKHALKRPIGDKSTDLLGILADEKQQPKHAEHKHRANRDSSDDRLLGINLCS